MGKEEEEEERALEKELEVHIGDHKDSLSAITHALSSDPHNLQLLSVQEELISAIKHAEEGLAHIKRARFLNQADADVADLHSSHQHPQPDPIPIPPTFYLDVEDFQHQPLHPTLVPLQKSFVVGSKCRFRHTDGRFHNAQILQLQDSSSALVSFLTPTSPNMMMCKFYLQQRCQFGANCRFSHGSHLPLASLKKYIPTCWGQSYVGSSILAVSETRPGIWREAELESWDDGMNEGTVVFRDSGKSEKVGAEAMALSQYAQVSEDDEEQESDSCSDEESESSDCQLPQGLGFVDSTALQRGVQTDTAIFAKWENHTRGIASKMMASMGYREGMGLGLSGQGMVEPIPVKVLPPKQSLDHALHSSTKYGEKKKRSRGGKRKRDKKHAEAARAAKQEEEQRPDVFSLINKQLAHGEASNEQAWGKKKQKGREEKKEEDRGSLIAYEDEVKGMRTRVQRLEEMVNRNRKEKAVYEAATRKLEEARKSLVEAQAKHASASHALVTKENEKRWLKF